MEIIFSDYKIYVSLLSLLFGIWQYWQKRKIKEILALEAIELHKNVGHALFAVQNAKEAIKNNKLPAYEVGMAEGFNQAMLHESAKLYCNMKNTTIDDIDELIINNQLIENYRSIYYSFSNSKKGFVRKMIKYLKKIY